MRYLGACLLALPVLLGGCVYIDTGAPPPPPQVYYAPYPPPPPAPPQMTEPQKPMPLQPR